MLRLISAVECTRLRDETKALRRPPLNKEEADVRKASNRKSLRKVLLLRTDVGQAASITTCTATVPANVVIEERLNGAATERSAGGGIVGDGHIRDSRNRCA